MGLGHDSGGRMTAVALAGLGLISPLGPTPGAFWRGLLRGQRAFGEHGCPPGDFRSRVAGIPRPDEFSGCGLGGGDTLGHQRESHHARRAGSR